MKIVIDSREQLPLWQRNILSRKLNVGDYSFEVDDKPFDDICAIERKSAMDLVQTLSRGHDRFKREIERSKKLQYFAIVVDCTYYNIVNKKYPNSFRSKIPGYVTAKTAITMHHKYNIPIFFTTGRVESKNLIKALFNGFYEKWVYQQEDEI